MLKCGTDITLQTCGAASHAATYSKLATRADYVTWSKGQKVNAKGQTSI